MKKIFIILLIFILTILFGCNRGVDKAKVIREDSVSDEIKELRSRLVVKPPYRSNESISQVIVERQHAIDYCYQQEAKRNPDLKGDVTVRFTIEWDGKVSNVELVNSTLNNTDVEKCILDQVRDWKFAPLDSPDKGKVTIKQKFIFN